MLACPRLRVFRASHSRLINVCGRSPPRSFTSQSHERIGVRCGSAGHVTIDLVNIAGHPPNSPLFIQLPPFPSSDGEPAPLPSFLQGRPVATINYRWNSVDLGLTELPSTDGLWPTPIHDASFAYSWLVENLAPQGAQRRDIYVYGSHLGASLATSLALTETQPHQRFAVRGLVSYNGIYNWTMFFPDHPANRAVKRSKNPMLVYRPQEGTYVHYLQQHLPVYFQSPSDMFDPFVSPSLFFHNPGLRIPSSYTRSEDESAALEVLINPDAAPLTQIKTPRKSRLVFPPRKSTLKVPETLLLYDALPAPPLDQARRRKRAKPRGNSLELQAQELAEMMQRSIEKVELKERSQWDEDIDSWEDEPARRVKVREAGEERQTLEMGEQGQEFTEEWLTERVG